MARDAAIGFKRAQLEFVEVHDFAAAAIAAFEQHARDGFGGFGDRREIRLPTDPWTRSGISMP